MGYVRQNFWPLRQFTDLTDVNRQVREWLKQVANPRLHRETRQRPVDRFRNEALRPLPALTPDYRDSVEAPFEVTYSPRASKTRAICVSRG